MGSAPVRGPPVNRYIRPHAGIRRAHRVHIRVGFHRRGIGSQLIKWAKSQSAGSLWLYTFARNTVAQAFYEHHGFRVVARGFEPAWQLEDIKYQWSVSRENAA